MPPPFPGMDPFLESPVFFGTLHDGLIYNLQSQLQRELPGAYYAASSDRRWVEVADEKRMVEPDVNVLRGRDEAAGVATAAGGAAVAEPVVVPVLHDEFREPYVDILTRQPEGELVVATIEVLSPANKRGGQGRDLYLQQQRETFGEGRTHLIEIDLLRGGDHTTAVPRSAAFRRSRGFDYHICVRRADRRIDALVYPVRVRDRLPRFPIPLLPGDGEVIVDLQAAFDRTYDDGPFTKRVDYRGPVPDPPLSPEDAAWVTERLKAAGK
ncbi:MAG TPA: DUF4058 family protein [Planctomycetaceae bacterium]